MRLFLRILSGVILLPIILPGLALAAFGYICIQFICIFVSLIVFVYEGKWEFVRFF